MPREVIQRVVTPLYDKDGRHVADRTDEYWIDQRDGLRQQAPHPSTPQTLHPTPPAQPPPPAPIAAQARPQPQVVTLTPRQFGQLLVQATQQGVPKPPQTLDAVVERQREMGRRP